jgi:hypothetical protein
MQVLQTIDYIGKLEKTRNFGAKKNMATYQKHSGMLWKIKCIVR